MTSLSWITSIRPYAQISPHSEALEVKKSAHLFWRDTVQPTIAGVWIRQVRPPL